MNEFSEYIIDCENLVKIYKTPDLEVLALQGLDLQVRYGEVMAIIGNSGSGKSTFLNILGGLDKPSAGKLEVDGKNLFKLNAQELVDYQRYTVGFVWQNNARNLLPYMTALQNVMLPMQITNSTREKQKKARELLALTGMESRADSRLDQLSGGEQQRIAIAIALANEPKLLLADEPTGSVDLKNAARILEIFRNVNKELGTTVLIVTHDRNIAKMVERVVSIRDGKVSSEFLVRQDYIQKLQDISGFGTHEETQDEFVVLDRAGRLQLPQDYLERLGLSGGKRVQVTWNDGKVEIRAPEDTKNE
ncbi:MAG: ABC transporter ATP-binding protein [Oscillospiraceae bacterium]|nr:ABC transporter ATP-binding protein [Oscillospiraceae bacterium]